MTVILMSQTVGELISGSTYIVRARKAEAIVAATQGTKSTVRGAAGNVLPNKTGKRDN